VGESYIDDVQSGDLLPYVKKGTLLASTNPAVILESDVVIVCVPTPLNKTRDPDMRFILSSLEDISRFQHPGMLVVLESTTYPGTTREVLVPRLTENGAVLGETVFIAFSPERVDPGNAHYGTRNTPKVIGGASEACMKVASALYSQVVDTIVPVSSPDAAEMVKLLENTFRAVNIGLVNEIAMMSRRLGIDPWEVIRAAATKPFGFMPFYPGPGLGGHCIPIDPLYLSWKLKSLKGEARFIELADQVNSGMPKFVVQRAADELNDRGLPVKGSKILVAGVAYKANIPDMRESPAIEVIHELRLRGAVVSYMDPHVPSFDEDGISMQSVSSGTDFSTYDLVVLTTNHEAFDYKRMANESRLLLDTRNALRAHNQEHIKTI
jgi:UDP-N-acetyl-D-glucosamine dehydrogenase